MATDTSTSGSTLRDRQGSRGSQHSQGSRGRQWALWFGLFGGVAAWTLHLAIAYPLVYNGCALGIDQLSTWLLVLTAVLGAVALLATIAAFFTWRAADTSRRGIRSGGTEPGTEASLTSPDLVPALSSGPESVSSPGGMLGSRRLLGLMGMGLSGLALLIMIFSAIAIVGLGPCYYR